MASAKPATVPVGSADWLVADRERGAAGPEAQGEVARAEPETQGGRHVVARPGADRRSRAPPTRRRRRPGRAPRGARVSQSMSVADQAQEVVAVAGLAGRPVPGSRGVAPVGGPSAGQAEGQPVVRQQDGRGAPEGLGLAAAQPVQLGDGEAGDGDAAAGGGPAARPPGSAARSIAGVGRRLGVVPELGGPQHLAVVAEDDEPVLLRGDGDGGRGVPRPGRRPRRRRRGTRPPTPRDAARCAVGTWAGARRGPDATTAPVSTSRTWTLHAEVDESTPTTSGH